MHIDPVVLSLFVLLKEDTMVKDLSGNVHGEIFVRKRTL